MVIKRGRQKESILLTEYLKTFHRTDLQWKRVRLGIPANPAEAKLYSVLLRWADAIVIHNGFVLIIETKLRPELGAIGQLEGYKELFKVTPEFSAYEKWPIKLILVSPVLDLAIAEICKNKGITYDIFKPEVWE